jgi:hypothetical protein
MHGENMSGIGKKILSETETGELKHRLLTGYWEVSADGNQQGPAG